MLRDVTVFPEAFKNRVQPGKNCYTFKWHLSVQKDFNKFLKLLMPLKIQYTVGRLHNKRQTSPSTSVRLNDAGKALTCKPN